MAEQHEGAAAVVSWMMREGRHMTHMRELGDEMCHRVVTSASFAAAAELPLESLGLHPLRGVDEPQEVFSPLSD